jgi:hypothetical protein
MPAKTTSTVAMSIHYHVRGCLEPQPTAAADSLTPSQFGKRSKREGLLGGGRSGAVAAQVTSSKIRPQRRRKSPKTNKQRKQLPLTSIWIG